MTHFDHLSGQGINLSTLLVTHLATFSLSIYLNCPCQKLPCSFICAAMKMKHPAGITRAEPTLIPQHVNKIQAKIPTIPADFPGQACWFQLPHVLLAHGLDGILFCS